MSAAPKPHTATIIVLFFGVLMSALDIAIVGPALPAIQKEFAVSERLVAWIFTVYILFFLIGTPLMARLSDMHGRRSVFTLDVLLFGLGSLAVALAPGMALLIAGRAVQGFGAGGIMPVANAVIGDMFPVEKRGTALGFLQAVFGISFVLGPVLGGFFLLYSWRYLFLINVPVAAAIIVISMQLLPHERREVAGRFDWTGMALTTVFIAAFSFGINRIDSRQFVSSMFSARVLPFLLVAAAALPLLVVRERRINWPVLPVRLLCSRQVVLASLMSLVTGITISSFVFMPSMATVILGLSQSNASFIMLPLVASLSIVSIIAGRMLEWVSAKAEMVTGAALTVAGMYALSAHARTLPLFILAGVLIGSGLAVIPIRFVMLAAVPSADRTAAQGLSSISMSMGQMTGGVLLGALLASAGSSPDGYFASYRVIGYFTVLMLGLAFAFKGGKTFDTAILDCR